MSTWRFLYFWVLLSPLALVVALFDRCNHVIDLREGEKIYINSPYYPLPYPAGTSCRYTVKAPLDHGLIFNCKIQLNAPSAPSTRCQNDIFYFNREGSELLSGSEYFCGSGIFERNSFLNRAVISYISQTPGKSAIGSPPQRRIVTKTKPKTTTKKAGEEVLTSNKHKQRQENKNKNNNNKRGSNTTPLSEGNTFKENFGNKKHKNHTENYEELDKVKGQVNGTKSERHKYANGQHNEQQNDTRTPAIGGQKAHKNATSSHPHKITNHLNKGNNQQPPNRVSPTTSTSYYTTLLDSIINNAITITSTVTTKATSPPVNKQPAKLKPPSAEAGVSGAFAYVSALLTNTFNSNFLLSTTTTTSQRISNQEELIKNQFSDFLPSSFWRNSSLDMEPRYELERDEERFDGSGQNSKHSRHPKIVSNVANYAYGGGSFSCLVEVIEPQCDCGWSTAIKIADSSSIAALHEFPSMAGVLTVKYNKIFCGAAIIHHRYLLSAAHCFITPSTNSSELIRVVVGEHDLSTVLESVYTRYYDIESIIPHEHFRTTSTTVRNDIAILRTRLPIEWNRGVAPACLPFRTLTGVDGGRKLPVAGQRVDTAGWGTISFGGPQSTLLLKTTLDVIATDECKRVVRSVPPATFCTYTPGRDTCQYDSGGALYLREDRLFAVGIVSYGFACAAQQPSVNTKVSTFIRWIKSKTPEVNYCIK